MLYKELFIISFDEEHAKASGIPVKGLHFLFIIMVALVIASSMRIVGVLLVSSLMTLPVAAAIELPMVLSKPLFIPSFLVKHLFLEDLLYLTI